MKFSKMSITTKMPLNWYSSMKKKSRKIRIIFDIENWLWKSEIRIFQSPPAKRTLICQKKIFMEKCYFSLNQAAIWCGSCWKNLEWYLAYTDGNQKLTLHFQSLPTHSLQKNVWATKCMFKYRDELIHYSLEC